MKAFDKKRVAIENSHTKGEMEVLDNEYAASKAPSLTLQQAMELAKAHQEQQSRQKAAPKLVAVIRNGHTDAELDEMEERWANHPGPYLTLAEVLAIEKAKQLSKSENEPQQP